MVGPWLKRLARKGLARLGVRNPRALLGGAVRQVAPDSKVAKVIEGPGRPSNLPDWRKIVATDEPLWREALARAETGPRVLMASSIGGHPQFTVVESALNVALTLRGAKVDTLLCDAAVPACQRAKITGIAPDALVRGELSRVFCEGCMATGDLVFEVPGLELLKTSRYISPAERARAQEIAATTPLADIPTFVLDGLPIGEHAKAGALRYYGIGDLSLEPHGEGVLRRYLEASLLTAFAVRNVLAERAYDAVVINHGIYTPHGIVNAVARKQGLRTATWNLAYRKQCAIFSHGETYHHTLMNEPVADWDSFPWSETHEADIVAYLNSRRFGKRDWIWFNRDADENMERFAAETGIDWGKPVIGMLTNVVWDAQLHYPANAFPSMLAWVHETVRYFAERPDLQLLIRVHPGELAPPGGNTVSRQPAVEEIRKAFPEMPKNIFIIPPESDISTYAAMDRCDAVIIYGTKTGVELTSVGIPVIVAGEAWIRNKGLTLDATSIDSYRQILDGLPLRRRMDAESVQRARRYAYHFFFRRMVPLPFLQHRADHWPPFTVEPADGLRDFLPGRHPGLDTLCDGILTGAPFIYRAEELGLHDHAG
jgi:hypothetical protein